MRENDRSDALYVVLFGELIAHKRGTITAPIVSAPSSPRGGDAAEAHGFGADVDWMGDGALAGRSSGVGPGLDAAIASPKGRRLSQYRAVYDTPGMGIGQRSMSLANVSVRMLLSSPIFERRIDERSIFVWL